MHREVVTKVIDGHVYRLMTPEEIKWFMDEYAEFQAIDALPVPIHLRELPGGMWIMDNGIQ